MQSYYFSFIILCLKRKLPLFQPRTTNKKSNLHNKYRYLYIICLFNVFHKMLCNTLKDKETREKIYFHVSFGFQMKFCFEEYSS